MLLATRFVLAALAVLGAVQALPSSNRANDRWWNPLASSKKIPTTQEVTQSELTTPRLIAKHGYTSESHTVKTADGYLLTLHRIPNPGKEVVLLQHGILCSSADWVVLGARRALAFLLHEAGYDVWMGNARGNKFSRDHVKYTTKDSKYWDFSWHEIGIYDLPAMIDYILAKTDKPKLTYIGHSQGTTAFFVMASLRPQYNNKIRSMHALAPVAYLNHIKSAPLKLIAMGVGSLGFLADVLGVHEFLPSSRFLSKFEKSICSDGAILQPICTNALFLIAGYDIEQLDMDMVPDITANSPAGCSTKQVLHYGQLVNAGKATFRQYDEGFFSNLLKYKSSTPPEYPVEEITAPVHLHYSDNDLLGVPECSEILSKKLPNVRTVRKVPRDKFNHIDFLFGKDAVSLLYESVIESINGHLLD